MTDKKMTKTEIMNLVLDREKTIISEIVLRAPDNLKRYIRDRFDVYKKTKGELERIVMLQETYISGLGRPGGPEDLTDENAKKAKHASMLAAVKKMYPGAQALQRCPTCKNEIDLNTCHCGTGFESHQTIHMDHIVVSADGEANDSILWVCTKCWPGTNEVLIFDIVRVPPTCELCGAAVTIQEINPIWRSWLVAVLRRHWEEHKA